MKQRRVHDTVRRGVSFGTVLMTVLTMVVIGVSAAVFPRLLDAGEYTLSIGDVSVLSLDRSMPELAMQEIPIVAITPVPEVTPIPDDARPAATSTPAPTVTPVPGGKVTLTIGGSVNIDDAVRKSAYYSEAGKYDFTEIMALLDEELESDIALVTLENVTQDADKVSTVNAPSVVMDMLADAGFDMVVLGYSKAMDKGLDGLKATMAAARERDLIPLGVYDNELESKDFCIVTVDQVRVAFLHYTESVSSTGKKAIASEAAAYALPTILVNGTEDAMLADVRAAKEQADIVIVSLNWGTVSASKPTGAQQELAQKIADAGANVIVGAGSRVVQPVAWLTVKEEDGTIRQTLCAWSLGSLLNESRKDGNVLGMLLQLQLAYDGDSISFEKVCYTPTYIWRYKQDGKDQYRIVASDQLPPDGMADDQIGYMEKALRNLQKYLGDSPVTPRDK